MKGKVCGMPKYFRQYCYNGIEWSLTTEFGGASH